MKDQQIYVELLDEGTIVYRPVSTIHIKNMIFKIEGNVPEGETWIYMPGEIVECRQQQFSDGKTHLIAFRLLSSEETDNL